MLDLSRESIRSSMSFIERGWDDWSSASAMMSLLAVGLMPCSMRSGAYFSCVLMPWYVCESANV